MIVGVAKEIKDHETRVGLVPSGVTALREAGHRVLVETQAGTGSSIPDSEYIDAGAEILPTAADVWSKADLVIKVKEPQPSEYAHFRPGLILFTYLHLAPLPELTRKLVDAKVNSVAYETIREADGSLPLLTPMSEVAGTHGGAGGRGVSGTAQRRPRHFAGRRSRRRARQRRDPGRRRGGPQSAKMAVGLGRGRHHHRSQSRPAARARRHLQQPGGHAGIQRLHVRDAVRNADLVVGAVLIPGRVGAQAGAARNVEDHEAGRRDGGRRHRSRRMLRDLARHHAHRSIYFVDGVLHYCVSNMPAAVPHTSTYALTNATFPYLAELCAKGLEQACQDNPAIRVGVNTYAGHITHPGVAESQGLAWSELTALL
jgi:alanine dehydrogenase